MVQDYVEQNGGDRGPDHQIRRPDPTRSRQARTAAGLPQARLPENMDSDLLLLAVGCNVTGE